LCGLAGSGKSTAAKALSARLKLPHVSAGDLVRKIAKQQGIDLITLGRYAEKHPEFDRKLDYDLLDRAREGGVIIDGRATAYLARKFKVPALKVFLAVDPKVSAKRVAGRDGLSPAAALRKSALREREIARRLKKLHGLDTSDDSYYDVVIHTDDYAPGEVVDLITHLSRYGN
jgi:cytidylate kinase